MDDVSDVTISMRLKLSEHWEVRFKGQVLYSFTSSKSAHDKRRSLVQYETGGYSVVRVRRFKVCR